MLVGTDQWLCSSAAGPAAGCSADKLFVESVAEAAGVERVCVQSQPLSAGHTRTRGHAYGSF